MTSSTTATVRISTSPIAVEGNSTTTTECSGGGRPVRAQADPNIYRNDRVLRALIRREVKHAAAVTSSKNYFGSAQPDLRPGMRREVANWMLEVCEEEAAMPHIFCLAINYLDRFLAVCKIRKCQLQLLGAVCLLVSWKVRSHKGITAQKLIEYTDYNITIEDLLEWEFLLLTKLDWDLSAVIAPDYVEHILQRLVKLDLVLDQERAHKNAETLIYLCYSHLGLASYPPSLIAVSSILTALRPALDALPVSLLRDTPSPSSTSSAASSITSSPPPPTAALPIAAGAAIAAATTLHHTALEGGDPLGGVMAALERLSLMGEPAEVRQCMGRLEELMRASLPPSPAGSDDDDESPVVVGSRRTYFAAVAAAAAATTMTASTPTPVLQPAAAASRSLFGAARVKLLEETTTTTTGAAQSF